MNFTLNDKVRIKGTAYTGMATYVAHRLTRVSLNNNLGDVDFYGDSTRILEHVRPELKPGQIWTDNQSREWVIRETQYPANGPIAISPIFRVTSNLEISPSGNRYYLNTEKEAWFDRFRPVLARDVI